MMLFLVSFAVILLMIVLMAVGVWRCRRQESGWKLEALKSAGPPVLNLAGLSAQQGQRPSGDISDGAVHAQVAHGQQVGIAIHCPG